MALEATRTPAARLCLERLAVCQRGEEGGIEHVTGADRIGNLHEGGGDRHKLVIGADCQCPIGAPLDDNDGIGSASGP